MTTNTEHFDVIVIGSGAGGTLTHALAPTGRRILLLERGDWMPHEPENWDSKAIWIDKFRFRFRDRDFGEINHHETNKMKIATGAWWTFLSDADLEVQRELEIDEYTDSHHAATVPHTLVLAPELVIDKVYCGYWFWSAPRWLSCGPTCRTCSAGPMPISTRPPRWPALRGRRRRARSRSRARTRKRQSARVSD